MASSNSVGAARAGLADPYGGLAGLPSDFVIPQWQKGDKLSDSGEELGDSSSDASSILAAGWNDSSSEFDDSGSEADDASFSVERDVNQTPRASKTSFKGKERATEPQLGSPARQPSSSTSNSAKYTIRQRPRSNSRPTGIAPGPAAKMFSDFSHQSSSLPTLVDSRSSDFQSRRPLRSGFLPQQQQSRPKPSRGLDRAISAPTNLFGGSPPVQPKQAGLKGKKSTTAPLASDTETEEDIPSSPEHSVERIISMAWEAKQNYVDLGCVCLFSNLAEPVTDDFSFPSSRTLQMIPECISQIAMFETRDIKTNISSPTPMRLYLPSTCLTTAGLHPALFKISNLYLLSLRQNQITHLPPAIAQLKNLKHLLLFNNKLSYLPAEILELDLEELQVGSNPLLKYTEVVEPVKEDQKEVAHTKEGSQASAAAPESAIEATEGGSAAKRHLAPRKQNFQVPSLIELCTRRLLEPIAAPKVKSFSPTASGRTVRRHFDLIKESLQCNRLAVLPPAHLLKPFLPLLQPIPHHLRRLLADLPPESAMDVREIQTCSACKAPCSEFAEERLEWRHEIAGQKMCAESDKDGWVPILWRGCSANCLDFLDH